MVILNDNEVSACLDSWTQTAANTMFPTLSSV